MDVYPLQLYTYWRSTAAFRVRIALNLKKLDYEQIPIHLVRDGGEQHNEAYSLVNPQRQVPVLRDGDRVIMQSMAIIEYLEELYPENSLLPSLARERARVRGIAQLIACDMHPLNNLRVLNYLTKQLKLDETAKLEWYQHWMNTGFKALEHLLAESPTTGAYCEGESPTLADLCLVPQVYNAVRWDCDLRSFPEIMRINNNCLKLDAFHQAAPEQQADAVH